MPYLLMSLQNNSSVLTNGPSTCVCVCDEIATIAVSYAEIIPSNCLDKVSNVEQLDVLNGPVMTAEHLGHMDGPR